MPLLHPGPLQISALFVPALRNPSPALTSSLRAISLLHHSSLNCHDLNPRFTSRHATQMPHTNNASSSGSSSRIDRLAALLGDTRLSRPGPQEPKLSVTQGSAQMAGTQAAMPLEIETISSRPTHIPGTSFCPILALARLPYKFLPKLNPTIRQDIARRFFDQAKFWDRRWDVYHLHPDLAETDKPLFFVTEQAARDFVSDIVEAFPTAPISFPDPKYYDGFIVDFDSILSPSWLGQSASRDEFDALKDTVQHAPLSTGPSDLFSEEGLVTFRSLVQAAIDAPKAKRQQAEKARESHNANMLQLQGVKRSLGLAASSDQTVVQVDKPVPHAFENDVVFICCDVESFELNHNLITEIGIATLDTRDLLHLAPGPFAQAWRPQIRARHFRIEEFQHLENHRFVQGCADGFRFGVSEFVSIRVAPRAVAQCFRPPFGKPAPGPHDPLDYDDPTPTTTIDPERRNVVLVGHDTKTDVAYLRKLGYDVTNLGSLISTLDTAQLWRAHVDAGIGVGVGARNPPALARICSALDVEAWGLHNAGNDAVYTLQAMLGLCVCSAEGRELG